MIVAGDDIRVLVDGKPIEYDQSVQFDSDKIHVKKLVVEPFNEWVDKVGTEFNMSIDNGGPIGTYILKRATFRAEVHEAALCFLTFERKRKPQQQQEINFAAFRWAMWTAMCAIEKNRKPVKK